MKDTCNSQTSTRKGNYAINDISIIDALDFIQGNND